MIESVITIILAVAVAATLYYFFKKSMTLVINAIMGLIALYLLNTFHVMAWLGAPDIEITLTTAIICALGGLPGAVLLMVLHLIGITV